MSEQNFQYEKKKTVAVFGVLKIIAIVSIVFWGLIFLSLLGNGLKAGPLVINIIIIGLNIALLVWSNRKFAENKEYNESIKEHNEKVKANIRTAKIGKGVYTNNATVNPTEQFSCGKLQTLGTKPFAITEEGVLYGNYLYKYTDIDSIKLVTAATLYTQGVAEMYSGNNKFLLTYMFSDRFRVVPAIEKAIARVNEIKGIKKDYLYRIVAHTGTWLEVYNDYIILNFMRTGGLVQSLSNAATGGGTGSKQIDIADLTSIQFKEPQGISVGFIQFSYPGSAERRGGVISAIDDENAVPISIENLETARAAMKYLEEKRKELRSNRGTVVQAQSSADELKKFKELLDNGVITQEEFDQKKKQLLGL